MAHEEPLESAEANKLASGSVSRELGLTETTVTMPQFGYTSGKYRLKAVL